MKKSGVQLIIMLAIALAFCVPLTLQAQVGIGTELPDASAQLEIAADGKGVLIPRMVKANRPSTPATGLLIYQTDNQPGFYYYNGTAWEKLGTGTGTPGPSGGGGTIVSFSSGGSNSMKTNAGGMPDRSLIIGFGNNYAMQGSIEEISLNNGGYEPFSMPKNGTITALSAVFSARPAVAAGITMTVTAQLYQAPAGSNLFTPLNGALITLPSLSGGSPVGTVVDGIASGLNIPIAAGSRLLLVYSVTGTENKYLEGFASAGLAIN